MSPLLIVLLVLIVVFVVAGFALKWLFIAAVICAILAAFSYFSGRGPRV